MSVTHAAVSVEASAPPPRSSETAAARPFFIEGLDPERPGFNAAKLISHWANIQPDTPALARATGHNRMGEPEFAVRTFRELEESIHLTAHTLVRQGLRPHDRVALFVSDGVEFVTLTFALQRVGCIPVLIDPGMGLNNVKACLAEQEIAGFIGVAKAQVLRVLLREVFKSCKTRIVVGGGPRLFAKRLSDLRQEVPSDIAETPFAPHHPTVGAPATIVYTSGSTGVPKGVIYTHGMMAAQVQGVQRVGAFLPGEVHVACFPGFALYASGCGMTTVFPDMDFSAPKKASPRAIINAIDAFDATSAFASPALWDTFSRHVEARHVEFPRVRAFFSSGAAVQPALLRRLLPALPAGDIYTPYGATESLPVATMSGRRVLERTAALTAQGAGTCVGEVAADTQVGIIAITDAPIADEREVTWCKPGEVGEIIVRGRQVTARYDQRDAHTKRAKIAADTSDGGPAVWHRMGDVGYLDDAGTLWFCGRKTHRVETAQGTLFSVPCEAVLEQHPAVYRAALTWVGKAPTQTPVLLVELEAGHKPGAGLVDELFALAAEVPQTAGIEHIGVHPGFPVDRRHNAKIEREKLSEFAATLVRQSAARARP